MALPTHQISRRVYQARGIAADRIIILEGATPIAFDDLELLMSHVDRELPGQEFQPALDPLLDGK